MKATPIVFDATVAVDALLRPQGPAGSLVRRFLELREFELVSTEALLEEIHLAATDPKVLACLDLDAAEVERWVVALGVLATLVDAPGDGTGQDCEEPALAAAAAAGEAVVATLDPVLLARPPSESFEAVRPEVLLEVLEARGAAEASLGRAI
ncbi:MAG TPA: hypothetical protein VMT85_15655 [Thermoanaerobaculia bacterium]|nr:hypothetical protein [Thermoanaerobaculia bacterium]